MKPANRASVLGTALALALTVGGAAIAREAPTMTVAIRSIHGDAPSRGASAGFA